MVPRQPGMTGAEDASPRTELTDLIRAVQRESGRQMRLQKGTIGRVGRQAARVLSLTHSLRPERLDRVSPSVEENLDYLKCTLGDSDDVVFRRFRVGGRSGLQAALVYLDGLVDRASVNRHVLEPVMVRPSTMAVLDRPLDVSFYRQIVLDALLSSSEVMVSPSMTRALDQLLAGEALLFLEGVPEALIIGARGWADRGIEEPIGEAVIRGPRDGFGETLRKNTALIRRRIRDPSLRVQSLRVGRRSRTDVCIVYLEGVANNRLVGELQERLQQIDVDAVLESGTIEQLIESHPWSPFPQLQTTERPDRVASAVLEGRVAVLVDGTPMALILPATFTVFYQTPEDYYERFLVATLVRGIRLLALFASLTFTALYVALVGFHAEMLPTSFAVALAGARASVPFPVAVDALLLEVTMEVVREASVRLPRPIGPTIGIVGTLVIGQALTQAGIVSPVLVIVVAATTIASFALPSYSAAIAYRILKFPVILAAAVLGLYGIMAVLIVILIHLSAMETFGVPYLAPAAPLRFSDLKDTVVRSPLWAMRRRPEMLQPRQAHRMAEQLPRHQPSRPAVETERQGTTPGPVRLQDGQGHDGGER
ncbi:MAG: spore germination protein [Limnochordaceae bacterium]|nr:spore germination protein [Limnochordaceae bacterium]